MSGEAESTWLGGVVDRIEAYGGKEYELSHLPENRRKSIFGLLSVWAAATIVPSGFLTGGSVGGSLTTGEFLVAFFAGSVLMLLISCLIGFAAHEVGLTFHTLSRYFFGAVGSFIPSGLQVITRVGWGAVSLAFAVSFVVTVAGYDSFFGMTILLGLLYILSALFGFEGLKVISYVAIPIFLGVYLWGLFVPIGFETPGTITESMPLGQAIGIAAGFWAAGALVSADWLRYAQSKRDVVVSSVIALLGFNMITLGLGFFSVVSTGSSDITQGMADAGFIVPATVALILITWTTVDNWLYSGSLGLANITGVRKIYGVVIIGAVMIGLAGFQIHTLVIPWIELLGVFLPALAGPIFVEYYVIGNRMDDLRLNDVEYSVNWTAVGAWLIGSGVAFVTPPQYVVPVVSIAVSCIAYYALYLGLRGTALYSIGEAGNSSTTNP